ncbi:MAG: radical SAM protein, partial [Bacteroidota bacterium]
KASPIMLSGNTDCYQPAEAEYGLTRKMLEVLYRYRHPVGIITKSSLILRDIDLLKQLADLQLVKVAISLTSLDEPLQRRLEPRAASVLKRLKTIETLSAAGIPVNVMMAPVIPGLTEHEILPLAEKVAEKGAYNIAFTLVRLNGDVAEIFEDWIRKVLPDRADRVLNRIRDIHGGQLNDSRFGTRMSGEGKIAEVIHKQFRLARTRFFEGRSAPPYNLDLHDEFKSPQMSLF